MKIIEFYGLPGSGKSTVCNEICGAFLKNNSNVITYSDYVRECRNKRSLLSALSSALGIRWAFSVVLIAVSEKLLKNKEVLKRLFYCLTFIDFYNKHNESDENTFAILDEGIVQGVVSAFFDIPCSEKSLAKIAAILSELNWTGIYISSYTESADRRIINRNELDHGRCDSLCSEERLPILRVQSVNFDKLFSLNKRFENTTIVDGNADKNQVVENVKHFLGI